MNLIQRIARAQAAGFGGTTWGNIDIVGPTGIPETAPGGDGGGNDNGGGGLPWYIGAAPIVGEIGKTVASIWGNQYQQPTYQPISTTYPAGYNPNVLPGNNSSGVGLGIDGSGIRLSDGSHIGWLPIGGLVLAIVLVQSKGFSRK